MTTQKGPEQRETSFVETKPMTDDEILGTDIYYALEDENLETPEAIGLRLRRAGIDTSNLVIKVEKSEIEESGKEGVSRSIKIYKKGEEKPILTM